MKLLIKNTFKKIIKSLGRFLSIMFIIALGISVFIGLRESTAGMLYTADNYYDKNNLMDFKIVSTYGLTLSDIDALNELSHSYKVIPSYSVDTLIEGKSIRVHALEDVNNVTLIDGRMPKNEDECLADYYEYKIGEKIEFESKNLSDIINISKCSVVGTVKSVLYVRNEKGISTVGNGQLSSFVFVKRNVFVSEYYTEVYILAKNTKEKNSYYDDYESEINLLREELEELKPIRETIRYEEILKEANEEIVKVKKELADKISEATSEVNEAKNQLDKSSKKLEESKTNTLKEFEYNYKKLSDSRNLIIGNLNSMGISENSLESYITNINANINNLQEQLKLLDSTSEEYKTLNAQIIELKSSYDNLVSAKSNLLEIDSGKKTLDDNYIIFQETIAQKEAELKNGYGEYYLALNKITQEEDKGNEKIKEAREKLSTIEKPVWYLLDRTDNSGYISYKDDVIKVDAIAKILPIFFIIIVILMISNTLTRLIEEERGEIGILLSNGFSKSSIIFSYLIYVFTSGTLGIAVGLTIGYSLVPQVIYGVFLSRYYIPKLITIVSPLPFSLVLIVTLLIMTIVTTVACQRELKEVPAMLLRPKSPKSGKEIVVEKFKFLWSKLNFMWKITIRNLFRYKKRIVMTVLGVAGCTALLLSGMGINDSINTIAKIQYKDIIKYDGMYILDKEVSSIPDGLLNIFNENGIVNPLLINQNAYTFSFDNKTEDVYIVVPSNTTSFNNYVSLKSVLSEKKVNINNDGVIITEKMAQLLNITAGDMISIRNSNKELYMLYVSDVTENYVSHYIYMNENYYKEIFGEDVLYNAVIANGKMNLNVPLTDYNVLTTSYTDNIIESFNGFVNGLNKIIIMIIVFACFLALIVLYNLTIINVSERKREIATFKVLGFYDNEISVFVYRETIILTFLGIALGLFLGIYFHRFIIDTAETDNIMFLRKIKTVSYILSASITIIFSYIVQLIVSKTLKKIDMIDSLKSVE